VISYVQFIAKVVVVCHSLVLTGSDAVCFYKLRAWHVDASLERVFDLCWVG
jgi:hypothetical protein